MMDQEMKYGEDYTYLPATSIASGKGKELLPDIYCHTIQIVNICMIGNPHKGQEGWVLVDAGMPASADAIIAAAEERFGSGSQPLAILLTHGHFDHVGAIIELVKRWDVPVYAHDLELPYLTGKQAYPPPDPTVDGGLFAKLSTLFPNEPINLGHHVKPFPSDGSIPMLSDWRWIHTPGHTPGHISFYREADRCLIAGDAFVTVQQESIYKVLMQKHEISGPPKYFTTDWEQARESVIKLQALNPKIAVTGHGLPMTDEELSLNLRELVERFDEIAIPSSGKYVH